MSAQYQKWAFFEQSVFMKSEDERLRKLESPDDLPQAQEPVLGRPLAQAPSAYPSLKTLQAQDVNKLLGRFMTEPSTSTESSKESRAQGPKKAASPLPKRQKVEVPERQPSTTPRGEKNAAAPEAPLLKREAPSQKTKQDRKALPASRPKSPALPKPSSLAQPSAIGSGGAASREAPRPPALAAPGAKKGSSLMSVPLESPRKQTASAGPGASTSSHIAKPTDPAEMVRDTVQCIDALSMLVQVAKHAVAAGRPLPNDFSTSLDRAITTSFKHTQVQREKAPKGNDGT
ncbi:hypothetical protein GGF46_002283 [Coemansia sp. RSA 552]|nr:hypothetical protein GGF46_002283 [Coemansia sp. RSA 552]